MPGIRDIKMTKTDRFPHGASFQCKSTNKPTDFSVFIAFVMVVQIPVFKLFLTARITKSY